MERNLYHQNYFSHFGQQELLEYSKLGSVNYLKYLRTEQKRRIKRRKARKQAMKYILKYSLITLQVLFILWIIMSWIDVMSNNSVPNPMYQVWNFFTLVF